MAAAECAAWCDGEHDDGEACEAAFRVDSITAPEGLQVAVREGEHSEPVLFVEEIRNGGALLLPVHEFTPVQAGQLRDALMELACVLGACDCCRRAS